MQPGCKKFLNSKIFIGPLNKFRGDESLMYPQVTAYTHKDDNNKWLVKKPNSKAPPPGQSQSHVFICPCPHSPVPGSNSSIEEVEFVRNGDQVVLEHITCVYNPLDMDIF